MNRKQPLIIVAVPITARVHRGTGRRKASDWLALRAIAAEGFERIHRTNLIGMGVLPLEFKSGTTRLTLKRWHENLRRRRHAHTTALRSNVGYPSQNGETLEVTVTCRLDTAEEVPRVRSRWRAAAFAKDFLGEA